MKTKLNGIAFLTWGLSPSVMSLVFPALHCIGGRIRRPTAAPLAATRTHGCGVRHRAWSFT
jgi:hypothetical protein